MTKTQVLETLNSLPHEFSTEELIEKLLFIEKVQEAEKQVSEHKKMSLEQVKQKFEKKWSK